MKKIFLILFFYSILCCSQYNERTVIQDFNYDTFKDTIHSSYQGGSGFGGTYAKVINGKTKHTFSIDLFHSYALIKNIITVPKQQFEKEHLLLTKALFREVLPKQRNTPDASLQWILNSQFHQKQINHPYFDKIIDPKTAWRKAKIEIPDSYYITLHNDTLRKLAPRDAYKGDLIATDNHIGILTYNSSILKEISERKYRFTDSKFIGTSKKYKFHATMHGLYVQKNEKYKWLFINDYEIVGGPEKLRWESIRCIRIFKNYLILEQNTAPGRYLNTFIIDIETGIIGKLKFEFTKDIKDFNENYELALLKKDHFIVKINNKENKVYYEKLFKLLKNLKDGLNFKK